MKFNKSFFKKYYGKAYLNSMTYILITNAISLSLVFLFIIAKIVPPAVVVFGLLTIPVVSIFALPIILAYYVGALKMSQRQRQWFEGGILHVLIVPEDGFTWGGFVTHTKEFVCEDICNIVLTNSHIKIYGKILLIDKYNGTLEKKSVKKCNIPRNFTNEEEILRLQYPQIETK